MEKRNYNFKDKWYTHVKTIPFLELEEHKIMLKVQTLHGILPVSSVDNILKKTKNIHQEL